VIFQDFPGPGIFKKKKIQDFPGGVGTVELSTVKTRTQNIGDKVADVNVF